MHLKFNSTVVLQQNVQEKKTTVTSFIDNPLSTLSTSNCQSPIERHHL